MKGKVLVLMSGGIDSAVTAWIAGEEYSKLYALTFRYGQSHCKEVECALQLGLRLGVERHKVLDLPISDMGGSSLFAKEEIPMVGVEGIPTTWVPQRNSIFLAIAFGWAEVLGCERVYIGANVVDYSGYPDCRPEFIESMNIALNFASKKWIETGRGVDIRTPLMFRTKRDIIELGRGLRVPFENTWSCYRGEEKACGLCPSCQIRLKGFKEAGIGDPIGYSCAACGLEVKNPEIYVDCSMPVYAIGLPYHSKCLEEHII